MAKKKVFLGMSGGVDSSVSAALLVAAGYEVVGVFIKVWEPAKGAGAPCTWRAERRDAMRVAARLDIPLLTLDLSKEYKRGVIDYLLAEYKSGHTPNPDVMCNKQVKFGTFYNWAIKQGADYVATGHYAQVDTSFFLRRSQDAVKDQTYFLWNINRECLPHILFPIGHLTKPEVRKLAEKLKLPNAEKHDSQGLCFVGKIDFKDFLKDFIKTKPGEVVNEAGEVIGHHDGAVFYTIGERHGFDVRSSTFNTVPLYVIERDIKNNRLTVGSKLKLQTNESSKKIRLEKVNWLVGENVQHSMLDKKLQARIRHRGELLPCVIKYQGPSLMVEFTGKGPEAIATGQSLVLYDEKVCLGGGVIFC